MSNKTLVNFFDKREINHDLKELLKIITDKDIEVINYFFDIKKKMKKKELLEFLYRKLTDKSYLENLIKTLLPEEIEIIKLLMKNKGMVKVKEKELLDIRYLTTLFVIDTVKNEDDLIIYITDDVYNILKDIKINKLDCSKENERVRDLLFAMVNYYGVVSLDDLVDTYQEYYDEELKINDVLFSLEYRVDFVSYYNNEDEYFINSDFYYFDEGYLKLIIDRQKEFERRGITLNELLKYKDPSYIKRNEAIMEYYEFLKDKFKGKDLDEFIIYSVNILKFGISEMYAIGDTLASNGVLFTESELVTLMSIITKIYDSLPIYLNNGWTSLDFIKRFGKESYVDKLMVADEDKN